MSQNYFYPPSGSGSSSNASVAPNGGAIPGSSTLIAGDAAGVQTPVAVNSSGNLEVVQASGATDSVNLTEVGGAAVTLGSKTSANSIPVVIASDDTVAVSAASLPLPAGASTSALQTSGNSSLTTISSNQTNGTQVTSVSNFPATQPVSGTVTANQGIANATPWNQNISQYGGASTTLGQKVSASSIPVVIASDDTVAVSASSLPLPTGAATSALQTTGNSTLNNIFNVVSTQPTAGQFPTTIGQHTSATSLAVVVASDQSAIPVTQATPIPKTISQTTLSIGTTPTRLTVSGSAPAADRVVMVFTPSPSSSALFFIGNSSVSNTGSNAGVPIAAGQSFIVNNDAGDYWVTASVTGQTGYVMEQE